MSEQTEIKALLKKGGLIIRDFVLGIDTIRVIDGLRVKQFSLEAFEEMKIKKQIVTKEIIGVCSVYKLTEKKR